MNRSGWKGRVAWMVLALVVVFPVESPPHAASSPSSHAEATTAPVPRTATDSQAPREASQTVAGMVFQVDPESSRLDVLTGVGLALRVLRIRCDESTLIQAAGKAIRFSSLKRGDPVRVVCRPAVEGYLAIRIELLPRPGAEGGPP
ncbi:MAG: hypothetical protein L0170_01020 [Acidobacteria bacterium]|nr:hypothetical protein [Acidobacteriota bacterium]